jgi:hypothetical protein
MICQAIASARNFLDVGKKVFFICKFFAICCITFSLNTPIHARRILPLNRISERCVTGYHRFRASSMVFNILNITIAWFVGLVTVSMTAMFYVLYDMNGELHKKMARERVARFAGSMETYDFFVGHFRNITSTRDLTRRRHVFEMTLPSRTSGSSNGGNVEITMAPCADPSAGNTTDYAMSIWLDGEVEPGVKRRIGGPYDSHYLSVISHSSWKPARHPHCTWASRHAGVCEQCIQRELVQNAFADILAVKSFVAALETDAQFAMRRQGGGVTIMASDDRNIDHFVVRLGHDNFRKKRKPP